MTLEHFDANRRRIHETEILSAIETSLGDLDGKTPSMIEELKVEHRRTLLSIVALNNAANRTQAA